LEDEFDISQVTYPEYYGMCNQCVHASNVSVYAISAPYCTYEFEGEIWNIADGIERHNCFNDDPRFYNVTCYSQVANNTFDCPKTCEANQAKVINDNVLQEGENYLIGPDERCIFLINFWDLLDTSEKQLVIPERTAEWVDFYQTRTPMSFAWG